MKAASQYVLSRIAAELTWMQTMCVRSRINPRIERRDNHEIG
jgi:hypothetical protein